MNILDNIDEYINEGKGSENRGIVKYARQMATRFAKAEDDNERLKSIAALSILSIAGASGLSSGKINLLISLAVKVSK